jgi:hypothetical protein
MVKSKTIKIDISKLQVVEITPKIQTINNLIDLGNAVDAKIKYAIQLNPLYNIEANAIKIELAVVMDIETAEQTHQKVGEFSYDFVYEYDALTDITDSKGEISPEVFLTCSNISYSTLRGIIHAKSANTCLEKALLPIVTGDELMRGIIPPNSK